MQASKAHRVITLATSLSALLVATFLTSASASASANFFVVGGDSRTPVPNGLIALKDADLGSDTFLLSGASATPIPAGTMSLASAEALISSGSTTGGVRPATSTPNGYKLYNPGNRYSDYIYNSDTAYQHVQACSSTSCELEAETKVSIKQNVTGGSSKVWYMTPFAGKYSNPGGLTWTFADRYYCGVNVTGNDHECGNNANASDVSIGINASTPKTFEQVNGNTVFPMLSISTIFSDGVTVTTKFRGWDTLNRAFTTKLKASSDG